MAKAKGTIPYGDWRSDVSTVLWGRVNLLASQQYQERLASIIRKNNGAALQAAYYLKRVAARGLWRVSSSRRLGVVVHASASFIVFIRARAGW